MEAQESAWGICKKLYRFHVDYDPGIVVLISGEFIEFIKGNSMNLGAKFLNKESWKLLLISFENYLK